MAAYVGQQDLDNKRVSDGFDHRTTPHFTKYDDGPDARGFIGNSFIHGLQPHEFFFHAMAGRIGLIDTAVKTSETGYIQRRLVKSMEDCKINHDGTVRNAAGYIVQFLYGHDGADPAKLELQFVPYLSRDADDAFMRNKYLVSNARELSPYMEDGTYRALEALGDEFPRRMMEYYEQILEDRKMIIVNAQGKKPDNIVGFPVHFQRIIDNTHQLVEKYGLTKTKTDLDPMYVLESMKDLERRVTMGRINAPPIPMLGALIRCYLSPKILIIEKRLNTAAFDRILQALTTNFYVAAVQPGEVVGITAAQSMGELLTQLTLNTFHHSGIASEATQGVPRLREILNVSRKIKTPEMNVYALPEFSTDMSKTTELMNSIQITRFRDVVKRSCVYFDPYDSSTETLIEEDKPLLKMYEEFEKYVTHSSDTRCDTENTRKSPWLLRIEFDRKRMFEKNVFFADIHFALMNHFGKALSCVFSDDNSAQLVCRARLAIQESMNSNDILTDVMALEQSILDNVVIKGTRNIEKVVIDKPSSKNELYDEISGKLVNVPEWMIITSGSNLVDIMANPYVDFSRVYTNDVIEILEVLGVEAARNALFIEIEKVMNATGKVNFRHIALLVDTMTNRGGLLPIDRHGINKGNIGPLAKCSFEETDEMLIRAGVFCEVDNINGVSANIMLGQVPPCGTGDGDILIDEEALLDVEADSLTVYSTRDNRTPMTKGEKLAPTRLEEEGPPPELTGGPGVKMPEPDKNVTPKVEEEIVIV